MTVNNIDTIWQSALDEKLWSGAVALAGGLANGENYRRCGGLAWPDEGIAMQNDSVFDIASVTKVVGTATLLAMLHGRGLLDFDAPFTKYLPEYRGKLLTPVTVRELTIHDSGFDNKKPYQCLREGQSLRQAVMENSPVRLPSIAFEYSCMNYLLLGYIIEAITGNDLAKTADEMIFKPLSMHDTVWGKSAKHARNRWVKVLNVQERGHISDETAESCDSPTGNAGIFSTADDLALFCRMMLNRGNGILSPEAYKELTTDCMPAAVAHPHAVGWDMMEEFRPSGMSAATIYHSGWTGQTVWIDPEKQLYVIVLTNRTGDWLEAKKRRMQLAEAILAGK